MKNEFGEKLISQYDYTYDELSRRTSALNSGQAFAEPAFNRYNYNDRNELIESSQYLGTNILDTSNPVQSEFRAYEYDPIGNRIMEAEATDTLSTYKVWILIYLCGAMRMAFPLKRQRNR